VKVHEGSGYFSTINASKPWRERKAKRGSAFCDGLTPISISTDTQLEQNSEVERTGVFAPPSIFSARCVG
jgi:hypothetical protein